MGGQEISTRSLVVEFFVAGLPVPQGSKSGFSRPGSSFVQIVDDNKKALKPWRKAITEKAIAAARWDTPAPTGALEVEVDFRFGRPKSVRRELPSVKPDIDKLQRSVFDGITDAYDKETRGGVWKDDAQIVTVTATKRYADVPGVQVRVWEYHPTPKEGSK